MITLSVEQLRDFQRRTQYIQRNTTLPSLSNIKLHFANGKHYVTKNNLRSVCVALVRSSTTLLEHDPLLLDDRIFFGFVNITKAPEIKISFDDEQIRLTDGRSHIKIARLDYRDFPKTPVYEKNQTPFVFTKKHLDAIAIAKNFILNTDSGGNYRFVHMAGDFISGFHTNYFYINNQFKELPTVRIDMEMADVITAVEELTFTSSDNHYFFLAPDMLYIFTQMEGNAPNVKMMFERAINTPGNDFSIAKDEVIDFCNAANMVCESALADCQFSPNGGSVDLRLLDASYNRGVDRNVHYTGKMDSFNFDSKLFSAPMKIIPYELWYGKTVQNNMIINGENEYFTFMGLAPKQNG